MQKIDYNFVPKKSNFIKKQIKKQQLEKAGIVRKVEACKICDNNCGFCKFACNCYEMVEI